MPFHTSKRLMELSFHFSKLFGLSLVLLFYLSCECISLLCVFIVICMHWVPNKINQSINQSIFIVVWTIRFCANFTSMWYKNFLKNVGETIDFQLAWLATVAGKRFNGKFTAKIDFPIGYFYVTIADVDIRSLKPLHTLFDKYFVLMLTKFN